VKGKAFIIYWSWGGFFQTCVEPYWKDYKLAAGTRYQPFYKLKQKPVITEDYRLLFTGAEGELELHGEPPLDPEPSVSANSTTSALI